MTLHTKSQSENYVTSHIPHISPANFRRSKIRRRNASKNRHRRRGKTPLLRLDVHSEHPTIGDPIPFIIWGTRKGQLGNSSASWPGIKRAKNRTKTNILSSKRWFASFWNLMFHEALSKIFYDIFLFQSDIPCTNWATCRSLKPLLGRLRLRWPTVQPRSMKNPWLFVMPFSRMENVNLPISYGPCVGNIIKTSKNWPNICNVRTEKYMNTI